MERPESSSDAPDSGAPVPDAPSAADLERVRRVAGLARLHVSPAEEPALAAQFARMLAAFRSLSELELGAVQPAPELAESSDLRADRTGATPGDPERFLAAAPARDGDYFEVPKTVGGDA